MLDIKTQGGCMKNAVQGRFIIKKVILNLIQDLQRILLTITSHPRKLLSGIPTSFTTQSGGDSQLRSLGMTPNLKGFTLIELLVVVLIIGILAAVALPQYQKTIETIEAKTILVNMQAVKNAEQLYFLNHGSYTLNWEDLDVIPAVTRISQNGSILYAQDGRRYELSDSGTYDHVRGHPQDVTYYLYSAFPRVLYICYPKGTDKGKRVCRYLGCASDKVNDQYCYFTWQP